MMVRVFQIIGIVVSIYCMQLSYLFSEPLWILPLLYTILLFLARQNKRIAFGSPGMMALNITIFCRYVLSILACYLNGELSNYTRSYTYVTEAVLLMSYELIVVFIVIEVFSRKRELIGVQIKRQIIRPISAGTPLLVLFTLILFYIAGNYLHLSQGLAAFKGGTYSDLYDIESSINQGTHFVEIVWETLLVWIYVYITIGRKREYDKSRNSIHVYFCIVFTLFILLILFIGQTAINRWYVLLTASASLALLIKLFPKEKKSILFIIMIPAGLVFILATLIKNAGYVAGSTTLSESLIKLFNPSEMDSYFCGPVGLGNAIEVCQKNVAGFSNIFNDVLSSMPFIGRMFPTKETTVYIYLSHIGRGDLIIPLVGQSAIYFGYVFAPVLSAISVIIVIYFDSLYKKSFSYLTYIFAFISIWYGVEAMALNLTINSNWLFIRILPFFFILWITNKLSIRNTVR